MMHRTSKAAIGRRIVRFRKRAHLSQMDMAARLGITPGALNKIEKGVNGISVDTVLAIWWAYRIPLGYLLVGEREAKKP